MSQLREFAPRWMHPETARHYVGGGTMLLTLEGLYDLKPLSRKKGGTYFTRESLDRAMDRAELKGLFPSMADVREIRKGHQPHPFKDEKTETTTD